MSVEDYHGHMADRQAWRSNLLSPSGVHQCFRRTAYSYFGFPEAEGSSKAADLGTLLHLGWAALIADRFLPHERDAEVWIDIPGVPAGGGTADDVDYVNRVVTDLKSVSDYVYDSWLNSGPYESYWDQLEVYAYGLSLLTDVDQGPWVLRVVALDRRYGRITEYERPADRDRGAELVEKLRSRHEMLVDGVETGGSPEDFPREGDGPGTGMPCDYCPFLAACWPDDGSGLSPQAQTVRGDEDRIISMADEYVRVTAEANRLYARKKALGSFLAGLSGQFGGFRLSMTRDSVKEVPDTDAMAGLLQEMGVDVPMKEARRKGSLRVTRDKG